MDELYEAIEVFGGDLGNVSKCQLKAMLTYGLILLFEIVDVTVQYLDKELH